ncbi:MAG: DoxX family membrane protein [Candidatus Eremiobacteraeota bacterium]|nr:DoxX family membrane protein [Candidatus Eremiobacteraeota bacterium]
MKPLDHIQPYLLGALFVAAGSLHFKNPSMYERIMPPYVPAHAQLVAISGFFEILGGVGVALPRTRRAAGIGLIALLLGVFPANVYMATDAEKFASFAPAWLLYARLPLQFLLILWVYNATVRPIASEDTGGLAP